jgi:hypothetical protein
MWRYLKIVSPAPLLIKDTKGYFFILLLFVIRLPKLKLNSE